MTTTITHGPTAAEILTLLASIERHSHTAPAAIAFRQALRRKASRRTKPAALRPSMR